MSANSEPERAFVLGLDGIPWNLIEKWAAEAELPNFARMMEEGAAGPMGSTMPPVTALAWPSIATGVNPDKHGMYSFNELNPDYTHSLNSGGNVRQPELWDILSPSLVANVPMTYPAEEIDGKMVTGMMTPSLNDKYTHPKSLADEIERRIPDYTIGLSWMDYYDDHDLFEEDIAGLVETRRELMRMYMEEEDWRLFFFVYTAPDRFQHLIWEEAKILNHYKQLDDVLGEVMEYVEGAGANLFVVSDHGFGPIDKLVSVNRLFEENGYLTRKEEKGTRGALTRLGITKDRILGALDRVGIDDRTIVNTLPHGLVNSVAGQIPGENVAYDLDYSETVAFLRGPGTVYINDTERFEDGVVEPEDVDDVRAELIALLSNLTDPETGDEVLEVADGKELYRSDPDAPDIAIWGKPGYSVVNTLKEAPIVDGGNKAADHLPEGIFLAWGPDIAAGATVEESSVVDFAPTLLHSLNEPIPRNTDGHVLNEIFRSDSKPGMHAIASKDYSGSGVRESSDAGNDDRGDEDMEDVEERLKGLGYM